MNLFQIQSRALSYCPDALTTFRRVFLSSKSKFMLESSVVAPGFSRFTFMGDAHGPWGETVTYDLATREATIECSGAKRTFRALSLFDLLKETLEARKLEAPTDLPFDFNLGYVGMFGYELKAEAGGSQTWRSDTHDAALIFATRLIAIDHVERKTYLLHLVESDTARQRATEWFDAVEAELRALADASDTESEQAVALPRKRLSLQAVEAWIEKHAHVRHSREAYIEKIHEALAEIVNGESYEICLTNLISFPFNRAPLDLYRAMRELSPAPHAAYFEIGDFSLVGSSPERFLSVDRDGHAEAKPIKGTRPRGATPHKDAAQIEDLRMSEKDRAENLMIVDLLRNDLGQVCQIGSVHAPKLFDIETYSHVHQLVSTVRGTLKPGVTAVDCVRAAFPGGSMTGAPKKRTMEIIDRLEEGPRGIYSGAIGWLGLSGACDLSIVIRSVLINMGRAIFGVGGAITALSDPDEEHTETIVKARGVVEAIEYLIAEKWNDGRQEGAPAQQVVGHLDHACPEQEKNLRPHVAYWTSVLAGYGEPIDLAVPGTPFDAGRGPTRVLRRQLPPRLAVRLAQFGGLRGVSLLAIFIAAFGVLAYRQGGRDDICIGATIAGRDDPLIGFSGNILPLRLDLSGNPEMSSLIDRVHQVMRDALEHQALPFEQMIAEVPALHQGDGRSPLPVIVRHRNLPPIETDDWGGDLSLELQQEPVDRPAQLDLDLEILGDGNGLEFIANFDSLRFTTPQIGLMLSVLEEILTRTVEAPRTPLTAWLTLMSSERALIGQTNDTGRAFANMSVSELFAQQVSACPDAPACWVDDRAITYAELNRRSEHIEQALDRRGIRPGMRVALYHPRSVDFIAAILASFRLGTIYVPIDPAYPAAYVRRTLDDAMPAAIITTLTLAKVIGSPLAWTEFAVLRLDVDEDLDTGGESAFGTALNEVQSQLCDLAYIAYTSGSTGKPKGVMVEHRQLLNCLQALWARTPYAPGEVVGQKTSMSFVPSIKEMLSGLLAGIPQVIFADTVVKDAPAFADALHRHRVTRLNLVPSHLAVLLDHADKLGALRHVTTAGEPLSRRLAMRFAVALPRARLHNNYGCTELNDISYCEASAMAVHQASVPAGQPIANCRLHVLNDALEPVPIGAVGALFVEGEGVGPGYWNRPELTAERFVRHPSGARLLRTGDIGQWLADGQLLHLGREDFQIKVRGQRVELLAVELELSAHPEIAAAAASGRNMATGGEAEDVQLIAFCAPLRGARIDHNALHAWLSERLPGWMVPSRFIALDALPTLPNGKLDRLALRAIDASPVRHAYEAPQGELEQTLAQIWSDALGVVQVGRHDNFFAIGGHSLIAAQVAVRASEKLGLTLTVRSIFDTRSVHRLAALIATGDARSPEFGGAPSGDAAGSTDFVAFNTAGRERPLFLTHSLQGYSWYFEHLAGHIDASIPVYGLPPLPLGRDQPRTLQVIAARFVAIIKSLQPFGPYRLAGWSFGGLIAYEIAAQLIAQGDEIEFLGAFDTTLPQHSVDLDALRAARRTLHSFAMSNFAGFDPGSIDFEHAGDVDTLIEQIVRAIEHRRLAGAPLWHLAHETTRENRLYLERVVAHGHAMHTWRPQPLRVRLHLFRASDASITPLEGHSTPPEALGWQSVLDRADIDVVTLPGNHDTLVMVHAELLGQAISDILNRGLWLHGGKQERNMGEPA